MDVEEAPGDPMRAYDALPIEISFSRAPHAGSPSPRHSGRSYRPLLVFILVLFIVILLVDSMTTKHLEHLTVEFMNWVSVHPLLGVVAVTVVYALATILFVPGSVLTIGTGFAFRRAFDSYGKALFLASVVSLSA
jgi:ABC-type sulfate transport system permease component